MNTEKDYEAILTVLFRFQDYSVLKMNTEKDYEAILTVLFRFQDYSVLKMNTEKDYEAILTVLFRFQDYYVLKMNTEKVRIKFSIRMNPFLMFFFYFSGLFSCFKHYERGFELDMTSNTVNLDNLESFFGILIVFFRFQDYYVFKMNTKKDYKAVSSLMRED
ncbi:unnamed protein product [Phyllotreta striolata]|uniref:Uncharacterized protein n=1 Tax=Phyllotreta striolata TaxID=444603 RepID=A0A9P0E006_PHYSR|nr:unnamed protein product [Phyllotreta striolata]